MEREESSPPNLVVTLKEWHRGQLRDNMLVFRVDKYEAGETIVCACCARNCVLVKQATLLSGDSTHLDAALLRTYVQDPAVYTNIYVEWREIGEDTETVKVVEFYDEAWKGSMRSMRCTRSEVTTHSSNQGTRRVGTISSCTMATNFRPDEIVFPSWVDRLRGFVRRLCPQSF